MIFVLFSAEVNKWWEPVQILTVTLQCIQNNSLTSCKLILVLITTVRQVQNIKHTQLYTQSSKLTEHMVSQYTGVRRPVDIFTLWSVSDQFTAVWNVPWKIHNCYYTVLQHWNCSQYYDATAHSTSTTHVLLVICQMLCSKVTLSKVRPIAQKNQSQGGDSESKVEKFQIKQTKVPNREK